MQEIARSPCWVVLVGVVVVHSLRCVGGGGGRTIFPVALPAAKKKCNCHFVVMLFDTHLSESGYLDHT